MNDAKEYLLRIRVYDDKVDDLNADISMLEDMLYKITPDLKPDAVSFSGNQDKLGSLVADRLDKIKKRDEAWDRFVDYRLEAWWRLQKISRKEYREILRMRYFEYMALKDISAALKKEYRWVRRLHGRALQVYAKLMDGEK